MAKYTGYVLVPHNTYLAWKTNTLNNGYDVDLAYGCQCFDFASLFWYNVGFPTGYPLITASSGILSADIGKNNLKKLINLFPSS